MRRTPIAGASTGVVVGTFIALVADDLAQLELWMLVGGALGAVLGPVVSSISRALEDRDTQAR